MTIQKGAFSYESKWAAQFRRDENRPVVRVFDELDLSRAPELREMFLTDEVLAASAVRVDLSQVTFLDSSCISVLVMACKAVRARGDSFSIRCGDGPARHILEITGLLEYFEVTDAA